MPLLGPTNLLRELYIEDDVEIATLRTARLRADTSVIVEGHSLASELLDRAWGRDLIKRHEESTTIESCNLDRATL